MGRLSNRLFSLLIILSLSGCGVMECQLFSNAAEGHQTGCFVKTQNFRHSTNGAETTQAIAEQEAVPQPSTQVTQRPTRQADSTYVSSSPTHHHLLNNQLPVARSSNHHSKNSAAVEPSMIMATGYGAPDTQIANLAQRRLLARRASEVDAYRRLAERIRGVYVRSKTNVHKFITNSDQILSIAESYIWNAKVDSQSFNKEGLFETTLLLNVDQHFFNRIQQRLQLTEREHGFSQQRKKPTHRTHHHSGDANPLVTQSSKATNFDFATPKNHKK